MPLCNELLSGERVSEEDYLKKGIVWLFFIVKQLKLILMNWFVLELRIWLMISAMLVIMKKNVCSVLLNGIYGKVLSVYTEPEYRGKGLCTQLIKKLLEYGKNRGLGRIDLSATKEGYPIYKKAGFEDKENHYTEMRYKY